MRGDFATASCKLSRLAPTTPKKQRWKVNATIATAAIPAIRPLSKSITAPQTPSAAKHGTSGSR